MPEIKSVDDARRAYDRFYEAKNSNKRKSALQEWNRFYFPVIQKVIQDKDIEGFFRVLTSGNMPPEGKAKDDAEAAIDLFVSMISAPQQARVCYQCFPYNDGCVKKGHASKVIKRWDELSLPEIENAKTIPEIRVAVDNSFYNKDLFIKGIFKWADACQTVGEIKELSEYAVNRSSYRDSIHSSITEAIYRKKISILLLETPKVTDIETIKSYYHFAPEKSAIEIFIFERWLGLCTTPEQANEAFINAPEGRVACQLGAYKKVRDLALSTT